MLPRLQAAHLQNFCPLMYHGEKNDHPCRRMGGRMIILCGVDALPANGGVEHDGQNHRNRPADGPRDPDAGRAKRRAGEQLRQRHAEHQIGEHRVPEVLYEVRAALPAAAGVPRAIRVCICASATSPRRGPSPPRAVCIVKRKGHPLSVAARELERRLLAAGTRE